MAWTATWTLLLALGGTNGQLVSVSPSVTAAEQQRIELIDRISPSVVCIFGRDGGGGGSGVLVSPDGMALTNFHVTSGAGDFLKCGLNDGVLYDAVVVGIDPAGDLALIQLLGRDDFPAATLGDSGTLNVGDAAYALGNPFLLAADFQPTVTAGIISGLHRYQYPAGTFLEYTDCVQFDTSLNPGNSGGPLFNDQGEVIGINGRGSFEKRGRVNVGAGYAISVNQVKHFFDHLRSGRVVDHGSIEATVATGSDGAVRVSTILEDSDGYRQGLRRGDEIVSFAKRPIRSANQFLNVLGIYPFGWTLPLTYRRDGQTQEIWIRLTSAHRESELRKFSESKPDAENPQPGRDQEMPAHPPKAEETLPKELTARLEKRPGFANYHYNRLEQARLTKHLSVLGDWSSVKLPLVLEGTIGEGQSVTLTIAENLVGLEAGRQVGLQTIGANEKPIDEPAGTGGFLAGVDLMTRVLTGQTDSLAEYYYFGSEPLDGRGPLVDVLLASDRGGTLRFYISREQPVLTGFDYFLSESATPCQVRFGNDLISGSGLKLPARWKILHLGVEKLQLEFRSVRDGASATQPR